MITINLAEPISMIDEFLKKLGTQSLVDGDIARDQLLELRSSLSAMVPVELPVYSEEDLAEIIGGSDGPWDGV